MRCRARLKISTQHVHRVERLDDNASLIAMLWRSAADTGLGYGAPCRSSRRFTSSSACAPDLIGLICSLKTLR
jgi:hypothetical protein